METPVIESTSETPRSSLLSSDSAAFSAGIRHASPSARSEESGYSEAKGASTSGLREVRGLARLLPVQLEIRVPLASFRLRDLLTLSSGVVLETKWPASEDLPLESTGVQLAWAEFEVVDQRLAARVTRIA